MTIANTKEIDIPR